MADSFVRAVEEASAGSSLLDRIWWWRRRGQWSVLTALRLSEHVSLWETFETEPAQIRLRRRAVANNRARVCRLADALAGLDGVEACRVSAWSHRLTIDVCRDAPSSDRFLETVEQALACLKAAELLWPEHVALASPFTKAGSKIALAKATGARNLISIAEAGRAFSITVVGLFVPGLKRSLSCRRLGTSWRTGGIE